MGLISLMTSHPGAKRLSSIQTGLMVSLSHWLQWKAVKWRQRCCYRRGNSCITSANGEFTTSAAASEDTEQKLDVSSMHKQIRKRNTKVWNIYKRVKNVSEVDRKRKRQHGRQRQGDKK